MNENSKPLTSLKPADYNPRTITKHKAQALDDSITDFGDLSSIVNNTTTGNLVGGHKRIETLLKKPQAHIVLTEKYDMPDPLGTTALGYVVVDGTNIKLPYREVAWTLEREMQANIIANYAQGQFVDPMLAAVTKTLHDISEDAALKTGQRKSEITQLLKSLAKPQPSEQQPPREVFSIAGETYQLGHHRIVAGDFDLEFVDKVRQDYAEKNNQGEEWQTYCGPVGFRPAAPAQPEVSDAPPAPVA